MAISTPSAILQSGQVFQGTSSYTTGTFTQSNNSLSVAVVNLTAQNSAINSNPSTWTATGWTNAHSVANAGSDGHGAVAVFTKLITSGSSTTMTVANLDSGSTFGFPGNCKLNVDIYEFTGHNTSTPTGATAAGTSTSTGAITITLSGAPASTSIVLAGIDLIPNGSGGVGADPGSGWTEIYDDIGASTNINVQQQYRGSSTSTSVTWVDQVNSDSVYDSSSVQWAIEILAAGGGGASAYVAGQSVFSFMGMA